MESIPCVLMRGGSSKGIFFLAKDLPAVASERDRLLRAAMGSPDPRQIDGIGGDDEQSSKVVIVQASSRPGVDVEHLLAQVSVARFRRRAAEQRQDRRNACSDDLPHLQRLRRGGQQEVLGGFAGRLLRPPLVRV
ncbi:MAG TPA: hypothetical protein DHV85_15570 [Candidatus Accumulibacter sp.]|mgnify:CR=1 FL=1|nr:hypothetical protein [Accumulibacter sp.]